MATRSTPDPGASTFGWRLANLLGIASPYLVATALYVILYLSHTPVPHSAELAPPPPPPPVNGPSVTADTEGAKTPVAHAEPAQAAHKETPAARARHKAAAADAPLAAPQPVPVDPRIAGTMKLSGDPPSYPPIARSAGVQGIVVVDVVIGATGFVQDAHVISGPPLLQAATLDTIRAWHYRPWLVYGKAVPFETQVSIDFKINAGQ